MRERGEARTRKTFYSKKKIVDSSTRHRLGSLGDLICPRKELGKPTKKNDEKNLSWGHTKRAPPSLERRPSKNTLWSQDLFKAYPKSPPTYRPIPPTWCPSRIPRIISSSDDGFGVLVNKQLSTWDRNWRTPVRNSFAIVRYFQKGRAGFASWSNLRSGS